MKQALNYLLFSVGVTFTIILIWMGYNVAKILLC